MKFNVDRYISALPKIADASRLTRPAFTQWLKDNRPRKATKI